MWTTGAAQMIVRLTGSTLFSNPNVTSMLTYDHRAFATTSQQTPGNNTVDLDIVTKFRELRARSPYSLFLKEHYNETSKKYPGLKMVDVSKKISEAWRNLSMNEKEVYMKISQGQRTVYDQEKNRLSPTDLQKVMADEKTKRLARRVQKNIDQLPNKKPRSAFLHFISTLDRGSADIKDFMRGAARRWSQLAEQDKQKFRDLYEEEKQKYSQALASWASTTQQSKRAKASQASPADPSKKKSDEVKKTSKASKGSVKKTAKSPSREASKSPGKKSTKKSSDDEKSSSEDEAKSKKK